MAGKNTTLYAFAKNVNTEVDVLGLDCSKKPKIFKKFSNEELEKVRNDAHELKRDIFGKNAKIVHYDIYKYSNNRKVIILKKGGKEKPIDI